jgi:hypothetical protein
MVRTFHPESTKEVVELASQPTHIITYKDITAELFIDPNDLQKAEAGDKSLQNIIGQYAYGALSRANDKFGKIHSSVTWQSLSYKPINESPAAPPELVMPELVTSSRQPGRHVATD